MLVSGTRIVAPSGLILLLVALVLSPLAQAQSGEDVIRFTPREPGVTPRMVGLAGAGAGGVADWGAVVVNPAGLALVRASHVSGSLDVTTAQSDQQGAASTTRVTRVSPGHGAYVATVPTVRGSFVVGIGAQRTAALDRRLFYEIPRDDGLRQRGELYESGYLAEVTGVAAIEVMPRLFLGASFNAVTGDYAFTEFQFANRVLEASQSLDASIRGFNVRAGVVGEVIPGLRIGLAAETPSWLHTEETFVPEPGERQLISYTMQTPWRASAGVVYEVLDLLFSVDLTLTDWSQARLRPRTTFAEENHEIMRDYREAVDLRLGAEYDFGLGAVRAGYGFAQDPLRDVVETDRIRHTFASGLSWYLPRGVTLDVAASFTEFNDQVFPNDRPVREQVGQLRLLAGLQVNL